MALINQNVADEDFSKNQKMFDFSYYAAESKYFNDLNKLDFRKMFLMLTSLFGR